MPRLDRLFFCLALLTLSACCARDDDAGEKPLSSESLLVSADGAPIAELVFVEERLVRVDYGTEDPELRARLATRLETLAATAEREGLFVRYHEYSGNVRSTYGASPKPGERRFILAMFEHLDDGREFEVRVK